jgi:hypothetical protein
MAEAVLHRHIYKVLLYSLLPDDVPELHQCKL